MSRSQIVLDPAEPARPNPTGVARVRLPGQPRLPGHLLRAGLGILGEQRLTVVCAPTGYAKTPTVAAWLEHSNNPKTPSSWVRCSQLHEQPLWEAIAATLAPYAEHGQGSGKTPFEATLFLAKRLRSEIVVVIDDYELETSAEADLRLSELSRATTMLALIVIARRVTLLDGPLVAATTRVRLIGVDELRFTQEEAATLTRELGVPQSERLSVALERTRGWPLALSATLKIGSDRHYAGESARRAWDRAAPADGFDPLSNLGAFAIDSLKLLGDTEQHVLLAAADLNAISFQQVSDFAGADGATTSTIVEHLLELGFLTTAGAAPASEYRCHPSVGWAFAEHRRAVVAAPERQTTYATRAQEVADTAPLTALQLFCAAGEFEAAEHVLARNFSAIVHSPDLVARVVRTLPESTLRDHPTFTAALLVFEHAHRDLPPSRSRFLFNLWRRGLKRRLPQGAATSPGPIHLQLLSQAMVMNRMTGQLEVAGSLMRQVEGRLDLYAAAPPEQQQRPSDDPARSAAGALTAIYLELALTALLLGDIRGARAILARIHGITEITPHPAIPNNHPAHEHREITEGWRLAALSELALTEAIDGHMRKTSERLAQFEELAAASSSTAPGTLSGGAEVARALLAQETGDTQQLELAGERLHPLGRRFELWPLLLIAETSLIRTSRGAEAALAHLTAGLGTARRIHPIQRPWSDVILAFEAMLNSSIGNLTRATQLLGSAPADAAIFQLERARVALFSGNDVDAFLIAESTGDTHATKRMRVDSRLMLALAAWGCDRRDEALTLFGTAAKLIERYHLRSALVGMPFEQLRELAIAARDADICDLLGAVEEIPPHARATRYERLTAMELQTLAAIGEHRNASEAAESLFVTTGTVKKHLAAVYRKLRVGDRDAAILRASRMGLLD
ncbi:MAG: hypothetical protein KA158_02010 [Leucobacter sp.]|nr:hypothetical protein [Leucobacter sp.]